MLELQVRKRKGNKKLYKLLFFLFLLILAILLIKPTWSIWEKKVKSSQDLEVANIRLQELTERENALALNLKRLDSQIGKEEEIVRKYDVVREDEELAVILDLEEKPEIQKSEPSFLQKVFKKYFGWLR